VEVEVASMASSLDGVDCVVFNGPNCPMVVGVLPSSLESLSSPVCCCDCFPSSSSIFMAPKLMGKRPSENCSLTCRTFSDSFL